MEQVFDGYVETYRGLIRVSIFRSTFGGYSVYDADGEHDDMWYTNPDEFVSRYGLKLYNTLEDFKRGNSIDAYKVLV